MTRLPLAVACLLLVPLAPFVGAADVPATAAPTIMELKGTPPDWWTPEVAAAADAAGAEGKLLDPLTGETFTPQQAAVAFASVPIGAPDYLFVRPGALFLTISIGGVGGLCTYNFIYSSGTQIGTAGHCVNSINQPTYILAAAGTNLLITPLGRVADFRNGGVGDDYALINIDTAWLPWVDPNMAYLGGPSCSAWNGGLSAVKHVGHGIQTGLVASVPRVSVVLGGNGNSFNGIGEISGGDSGSPMIQITPGTGCALGAAAGIVTHCASLTGTECLPLFYATDIRRVPATVTVGFDPL